MEGGQVFRKKEEEKEIKPMFEQFIPHKIIAGAHGEAVKTDAAERMMAKRAVDVAAEIMTLAMEKRGDTGGSVLRQIREVG